MDRFNEVTRPDVGDARFQQQPLILPQSPPTPPSRKQAYRVAVPGVLIMALVGFILGLLTSASQHRTVQSHPVPAQSVTTRVTPHVTARPSPSPASPIPAASAACSGQVGINDAAGVLDAGQVCGEAAMLGYPISIYTTNTYTGGDGDFDQQVRAMVTSPRMIVFAMSIDMAHQHVHVALFGGIAVPLDDHAYHQAMDAFNQDFHTSGDYTGATIAALRSLQSALGGG